MILFVNDMSNVIGRKGARDMCITLGRDCVNCPGSTLMPVWSLAGAALIKSR